MTTTKKLGIWMDHSTAHVLEFLSDNDEGEVIEAKVEHQNKTQSSGNSENVIHNKEQHQQAAFYQKLGDTIKNYDEVILFGPTDAKAELVNLLRADHHFDNVKLDTKPADKMTDHQQQAFVREYFSKHN